MELTLEQEKALKILIDRYKDGAPYSVLSGYAGVGKSTCIKFLVNYLLNEDLEERDIVFTSFTGKAVQVMINKGNKNAMTLHKMLYLSKPTSSGKFINVPIPIGELPYKLIICDEVSMVSKDLVNLLLSHNIHVIFMGDEAQLPPVDKSQDNHLLDHPHARLTTIHRQAENSGIIRLSMLIREGQSITGFESGDALVISKNKLNTGMLEWADQILCATNNTRKSINTQCRELRGYTEPIEENEKVICLRNYWDTLSDNNNALTNGCVGLLKNIFYTEQHYPPMFKVKNNCVPVIHGEFITDTGDDFGGLDMDRECLVTGNTYLDSRQKYNIGRNKRYADTLPYELTYGYCITAHKAQGSEWNRVLVLEENFPFDKEEHKRWLYTAVTRGSEKVVLVR